MTLKQTLLLFVVLVSSIQLFAQKDIHINYQGSWGTCLAAPPNEKAFVNIQGDTIIPFGKYIQISPPDNNGLMFVINHKQKGGFVDATGKEIIPAIYDKLGDFEESELTFAKKDGKYGYIDRTGKTQVSFIYDDAGWFRNGIAWIKYRNKYGYINQIGKYMIQPIYDETIISTSSEDLLVLRKEHKYAFFSRDGKQLTNFSYDFVYKAKKGDSYVWSNGLILAKKGDKHVFLNNKLKEIIPAGEYDYAEPFNEHPVGIVGKSGKYGLIDSLGNYIIPLEYDKIYYNSFYGNDFRTLSLCKDRKIFLMCLETGAVNNEGFLEIQVDPWRKINNKQLLVAKGLNEKYGYITEKLDTIIPFQYSSISPDHNKGLFIIAEQNRKYGLIDMMNKVVADFSYDEIHNYDSLYVLKASNKANLINSKGEYIVDYNKYEHIYPYQNGRYLVRQNDKIGIITSNKETIIPCIYDSISTKWIYGPNAHFVLKEGKSGIIDYNGNTLIPVDYDELTYVNKDNIFVMKNKKWGVIDLKNNSVLPLEYDDVWTNIDNYWGVPNVEHVYLRLGDDYFIYNKTSNEITPSLEVERIKDIFRTKYEKPASTEDFSFTQNVLTSWVMFH